MANIPLKSITFPGLPDTYTVPQVDDTLTQSGQAADAKITGNKIRLLNNTVCDNSFFVEQGAISNVGVESENSKRIRTGYIKATSFPISIVMSEGYLVAYRTYYDNFRFSGATNDYQSSYTLTAENRWYRFLIKKADDSNIVPEEFSSAITSGLENAYCVIPSKELSNRIESLKEDDQSIVQKINNYYAYSFATALTSGTDLNSIVTPGVYSIPNNIASTILNDPFTSGGQILTVEKTTPASGTYVYQKIYKGTSHETYCRQCNNGSWSDWMNYRKEITYIGKLIDPSIIVPKLYVENGAISQYGVDVNNVANRIRTSFFKINSSGKTITANSGYEYSYFYYDDKFEYKGKGNFLTEHVFNNTSYYYRLVVAKTSEKDINVSDFSSAFSTNFEDCVFYMPVGLIGEKLNTYDKGVVNPFSLNDIFVGNENMCWSWWYYPIAVSFKKVRDKLYWGYTTSDGYTGIAEYDYTTKQIRKNNLKKSDIDDHNALAIHIFDDGTILCAYSGGHNTDYSIHIRVSEVPENIERFKPEVCLTSTGNKSYSQLFYYDGKLFVFYRKAGLNWAYRFTSDKGNTWSDEVVLINSDTQYYCKVMETTVSGLLRLCMYSNPIQTDPNIRMGFLDLSTGNIYNSDNETLLGTSNIQHTSFDIVIPIETGKSQRLMDVAVSEPDVPKILYAVFSTSSQTDSVYKLYDSGNIVSICNGGQTLFSNRYQLGCAFAGDKIVSAREADGSDIVELYDYINGEISLDEIIYSELRTSASIRNARPIVDINAKSFLWQRGYFNIGDYTDFNMDAKIYSLDQEEIII